LGWRENGYLPHRDEPGLTQFITFRLPDAFPVELRAEWEKLLKIEEDRKRRIELEKYLDMGRGHCHLREPRIAVLVEGRWAMERALRRKKRISFCGGSVRFGRRVTGILTCGMNRMN
jgi:hypothetical protein